MRSRSVRWYCLMAVALALYQFCGCSTESKKVKKVPAGPLHSATLSYDTGRMQYLWRGDPAHVRLYYIVVVNGTAASCDISYRDRDITVVRPAGNSVTVQYTGGKVIWIAPDNSVKVYDSGLPDETILAVIMKMGVDRLDEVKTYDQFCSYFSELLASVRARRALVRGERVK